MAKYTKKQLENLSVEQLKRIKADLLSNKQFETSISSEPPINLNNNIFKPSTSQQEILGYYVKYNKSKNYQSGGRSGGVKAFRNGKLTAGFVEQEATKHGFKFGQVFDFVNLRSRDDVAFITIEDKQNEDQIFESVKRDKNVIYIEPIFPVYNEVTKPSPRTNTGGTRDWMEQLLINWGPRCPESRVACWDDSDCPPEYYYCSNPPTSSITPTTQPGCCVLPEEQEIPDNEQTWCMDDHDCRPGFMCVSQPFSPAEYNECVPVGVAPPQRREVGGRTNTGGGTRGQCIGADWCGGPQETNNYLNPMCGNEPNLDPGGGGCMDPTCACPSTRNYCSGFSDPESCECCGTHCNNGPVGGCQWADCPYPDCDSNDDCQNYCSSGDSFIGSCNGCECVYEEYECDYGCNADNGLCTAAPSYLGPMDDAGPGSGDIGGPNEPGSMGCKDPDACNYCEDCNYDCPINNEWCFCEYIDDCGICGGPGAIYDCGCDNIPEGECDCDNNVDCGCGCGQPCNDIDNDGILDCIDDCVGAIGCDGACYDINQDPLDYDDCGVCGGDCFDGVGTDWCDGVCCSSSVLDECGVCNGQGAIYDCGCEGYSVCWDGSEVCDLNDCPYPPPNDPVMYADVTQAYPTIGQSDDGAPSKFGSDIYNCKTDISVTDITDRQFGSNICWLPAYHKYGPGEYTPTIGQGELCDGSGIIPYINDHVDMDISRFSYTDPPGGSQNGDSCGHAAGVLSVMMAETDNDIGIHSICPNCNVHYYGYGPGSGIGWMIDQAISDGVYVMGNSWGGAYENITNQNDIRDAAENHGFLWIYAAGNSGLDMGSGDGNLGSGQIYPLSCGGSRATGGGEIPFGRLARSGYSRTGLEVYDSNGFYNYNSQYAYGLSETIADMTGYNSDDWEWDGLYNGISAPSVSPMLIPFGEWSWYQGDGDGFIKMSPLTEQGEGIPPETFDEDFDAAGAEYGIGGGTSLSTPLITTLAGYLLSHNPDLTGLELKYIIQTTANMPSLQYGDPKTNWPKDWSGNHQYGFAEGEESTSSIWDGIDITNYSTGPDDTRNNQSYGVTGVPGLHGNNDAGYNDNFTYMWGQNGAPFFYGTSNAGYNCFIEHGSANTAEGRRNRPGTINVNDAMDLLYDEFMY